MAVTETRTLPAQFVEDLGTDLAKQLVAQSAVPVVSTGVGGISQQPGETPEQFAARQKAAQQFQIRQQSLSGLAPQIAGQDPLQQQAQQLATQGIGSYQPFLQQAQTQSQLASGLGAMSLGQLGTATSTFGGVGTGAQAFQQDVSQFMSPYQSQVIDTTLSEFDRQKAIQEKSIADQAIAAGAFGGGREGVQRAEFQTGAARERALLQAGLLQQGFGQAQQARQQDIQNRFNFRSSTTRYCRSNSRFRCIPIWTCRTTSTVRTRFTTITRHRHFTSRIIRFTKSSSSSSATRCTKRSSKTSSLFTTRTVTTIHWSCYRNHGRLSSGFPIF
jgi:hypothetical protein